MSAHDTIPFLDVVTPHWELEEELVSVFRGALRTGAFVGGQVVEDFEREFAQFCETDYCIGVGSGTDALRFALIAGGVRPGDTVITVPNTFIATTEAISQAGATPDFVDIDARTYNMDVQKFHEYLETRCHLDRASGRLFNERTGARVAGVVPVHLYGQMADMDPVLELAKRYNLFVIEDACQAHGAAYYSQRENSWKKAGSMGVAAAFSFYPGKNLGACGEAGAVTTNDATIASKVRMLRDHGQAQKYHHEIEGYNGRLDAIQAGILRAKLKHLAKWNAERCEIAEFYSELFRSQMEVIVLPYESPQTKHAYHLYVIRVKNRSGLQTRLRGANIAAQIHYPTPLHLQKAYASRGYKTGDFPIAEKAAEGILSLPMYPHLKPAQQKRVAQVVVDFLEEDGAVSGMRGLHSEAAQDGCAA